ncbi:unnamed protein product [Victoria cruziana]
MAIPPLVSLQGFIFYFVRKDTEGSEMEMKKSGRKNQQIPEDQLETVDLSGLALDVIPNSLNFSMIGKLDLSNNNLESIPESLTARLLNLVVLDVQSNQLTALPNSIGCLSKLKILNVSGNLLESFPKTIEDCRSLEELNANFNKLTKLPDTIGFELVNLKKLSVNSNRLVALPYSTSHLTALRVLDARLNCLSSLPEDMENLTNLEILNVSQNFQHLVSLPYSLGLLGSLQELDVSYNRIQTLPDSLGCAKNLKKLCVEGNPLVCPPMEVIEQSLDAVKTYLCRRINGSDGGRTKKRSWIRKLVKYSTFSGFSNHKVGLGCPEDGFSFSDYRSIDGLATPRHISMFSPRRIFSPKRSFAIFSPKNSHRT